MLRLRISIMTRVSGRKTHMWCSVMGWIFIVRSARCVDRLDGMRLMILRVVKYEFMAFSVEYIK